MNPNQLVQWRKLHQAGALSAISAGEASVPAPELNQAPQEIKALQRVQGKKPLENEVMKEAVEYGRAKLDWALALIVGGRPMKSVCDVLGVARTAATARQARLAHWRYG